MNIILVIIYDRQRYYAAVTHRNVPYCSGVKHHVAVVTQWLRRKRRDAQIHNGFIITNYTANTHWAPYLMICSVKKNEDKPTKQATKHTLLANDNCVPLV